MTKRNWSYSLILILISVWLGWTVIVDFFVVPTVFRTIDDFFKAGELGMSLFSQLNKLELLVSSLIIVLSVMQVRRNPASKPLIFFAFTSWAIVMFYFSFLTPKIISLTELWMASDSETMKMGSGLKMDIQQEHQFYHELYRKLDAFKLILLTVFLAMSVKKSDKWA